MKSEDMRFIRFFVILIAGAIFSCSRGGNEKLKEVDALCDGDPRLAMSMLDSIDYDALSGKDRHYYDLLSIKSRDKAYVRHTSDSLILHVIEYYSSHQDDPKYPEALYYGGRVYSDMGDLPTALEYFQKAIDATPDNKDNLRFKSIVLNQTGRLLHALRLDSAAIEYLDKSLEYEIHRKENDYGIAYTHTLLGDSYINVQDLKKARRHIDLAVKHSSTLPDSHRANILIYSARILDSEGKLDSALSIIRPLSFLVDSLTLSQCLALASELYRDAGIPDTAYMYARRLTLLSNPSNKRTGYKVIFSDKLRDFVPKDTLIALISEYKSCIEAFLDKHEGENAMIQNTQYNYFIHEREREKAEKKLYFYMIIASIAVIVSLILLAIIIYKKFKAADTAATLATAINLLKESSDFIEGNDIQKEESDSSSEETMDGKKEYLNGEDQNSHEDAGGNKGKKQENLSEIKARIMSGIKIADAKELNSLVSPAIMASRTYHILSEKIQSENLITISEEKTIFKNLEELLEDVSPGFFYRLQILTEGKVTHSENRIAMLIKCGFSPLQISILLGKEKNTISTHRRNLAFKITGQKKSDRSLDLIIVSL